MTVHVTCKDGAVDDFMRFADSYVKHPDGSLEVVRAGTAKSSKYSAGQWLQVSGDEQRVGPGRLMHSWFTRLFTV